MSHLLIIDDDDSTVSEIKNWLTREGYIIESCRTAEEGLRKLQEYNYDVAIVSFQLPDIAGSEICKRVHEVNPCVPLLLLGNRQGSEDVIAGLDAGAQDFLSKPFPIAELTARVRSILRRYPTVVFPGNTVVQSNPFLS